MKRKTTFVSYMITAIVALLLCACGTPQQAQSTSGSSSASSTESSAQAQSESSSQAQTASSSQTQDGPVVGIAWRTNTDTFSYKSFCKALEEAGVKYVMLDQVLSPDLSYDKEGHLTSGVAETGALTNDAGKLLRCNTWQGSNVDEAMEGISAVLFTGGEDISPSLYYQPQAWHGVESEKDYHAERDVSDFLLMNYCLERDIPVLGVCRGMQMLCVASGAEVMQDIASSFAQQGIEYHNEHRRIDAATGDKSFNTNDVKVSEGSLLYSIVKVSELSKCPCYHHQAVKDVDDTRLTVSGSTVTDGVTMIEAVERTDKTFALGLQFHPEISVGKWLGNAEDKDGFLELEFALSFFKRLKTEAEVQLEEDEAATSLPAAA